MKILASFLLAAAATFQNAAPAPPTPGATTSTSSARIPRGAKIYIADMNGFEGEMRDALTATELVSFVDTAAEADYIVTGWLKLEDRHRGGFYVESAPPAIAAMTVTPAKGGDRAYYNQIRVRFADHGSTDAAKKLAKNFFAYLAK